MSSPVPLLNLRKFFKYLAGCFAFDPTHDLGWRYFRRSGDLDVNMVFAHNSSQYLNFKSLADLAHKISNSQGKVALKNLVTVFRYPYEVVLDFVPGMAATSVVHANFLNSTAS